jgi:DmsE family decaheme c-type cytochrome
MSRAGLLKGSLRLFRQSLEGSPICLIPLWVLAIFLALTGIPAAAADQAETASGQGNAGFVGGEVCRTCHADVWATFYRNPHYKSIASGKETPDKTGCEGCHGPGAAHVQARGGASTIPNAFSRMPPQKILDTCLGCHADTLSRSNIRRSRHTEEDVVCTNCHSIHKPATPKLLLAMKQTDLCYSCHTAERAQFSMPFKHRVNEGFMQCTDCHNPHGAPSPTWRMGARPAMTEQAEGNEEGCLRCHTDKRGPFTFEHAAVRVDGCETCHVPHGSTNPRMLKRPVIFTVCLECHNNQGTFGPNLTGVPRPNSTHNLANPRFQNCTVCHVRIHGSNSDPFFFR